MTKDIVIVKDYEGKPLVRNVWGIGAKVVYVVNESSDSGVVPIGFPRRDVFRYDSKYSEILNNIASKSVGWGKLSIYCDSDT